MTSGCAICIVIYRPLNGWSYKTTAVTKQPADTARSGGFKTGAIGTICTGKHGADSTKQAIADFGTTNFVRYFDLSVKLKAGTANAAITKPAITSVSDYAYAHNIRRKARLRL